MRNEIKIVKNLIEKNVTEMKSFEQENWLMEIGNNLNYWDRMIDFSWMMEGQILYNVHNLWEGTNGYSLSYEATSKWQNDFYVWAKSFTKRRAKEPAISTIQNKITVYRDYTIGLLDIPETVFIPKRDGSGKVIDLSNEDGWQEIDTRDNIPDFGKALVARAEIKRGTMSDDAWTILYDPFGTVGELKIAIRGDRINGEKKSDFCLFEAEGLIYCKENDRSIPILEILIDNQEDDLFRKGISHLLKTIGSEVPMYYKE